MNFSAEVHKPQVWIERADIDRATPVLTEYERIAAQRRAADQATSSTEPPIEVTWPWPAPAATVTDVFGRTWTVSGQDHQIRLPVSVTPLFIEPAGHS